MQKNILEIKDLQVEIEGKNILRGLDLSIKEGEIHVIMGPNGAGKSTLANVIMGDPRYEITEGSLYYQGEDIKDDRTDERARKGIFLSFQAPEEIQGVSLENFIKAAKGAVSKEPVKLFPFKEELKEKMESLKMDPSYAKRYLNVGFSGGEKKKSEILQMMMLQPKLIMLDETDSGLDVDAVKLISENIARSRQEHQSMIIITHVTKILQKLDVDYVHVLSEGKIIRTGDASIIEEISNDGFMAMSR